MSGAPWQIDKVRWGLHVASGSAGGAALSCGFDGSRCPAARINIHCQ